MDGPMDSPKPNEVNPFDRLESVDEKKADGAQVDEEEVPETPGRQRALSSPKRGVLERRGTADSNTEDGSRAGFLSRVRSLKGSKRKGDRQPS